MSNLMPSNIIYVSKITSEFPMVEDVNFPPLSIALVNLKRAIHVSSRPQIAKTATSCQVEKDIHVPCFHWIFYRCIK